jgi:hypothetical protein
VSVNLVVARYRDGRVVKGTSLNVDPSRPACHVRTPAGPVEVLLADLKALFFVRTLDGDPARHDRAEAAAHDPRLVGGHPVVVEFPDGERIVGATNRFPPNRPFFYMVPLDAASNNVRILVNRAAARRIGPAPAGG